MIDPIGNSIDFDALGLSRIREEQGNDLAQEDFLQLMITQLENQDPFQPLESGEFLGQLAQFGTVEGLTSLNASFDQLAQSLVSNQALQAATLVGRSVVIDSDIGFLEEGGVLTGSVELAQPATAVRLQFSDAFGALVHQIDLGAQNAGPAGFQWNGLTESGALAVPGQYRITAQVFSGGQQIESVPISINALVESVAFDARGLNVNLRGIGELPFNSVRQISAPPEVIPVEGETDGI